MSVVCNHYLVYVVLKCVNKYLSIHISLTLRCMGTLRTTQFMYKGGYLGHHFQPYLTKLGQVRFTDTITTLAITNLSLVIGL